MVIKDLVFRGVLMPEEYSNGNVLRSKVEHLEQSENEIFIRLRDLENANTRMQITIEGYMKISDEIKVQINETNLRLSSIDRKLTAFDIDQAKKWTKVIAIGGVVLFLVTSVPGIVFTIMKISEMLGG